MRVSVLDRARATHGLTRWAYGPHYAWALSPSTTIASALLAAPSFRNGRRRPMTITEHISMVTPRIHTRTPAHCEVSFRNLYVVHAVGEARDVDITALVGNFQRFAAETPGSLGFVLSLLQTARPPGSAPRKALADLFTKHAKQLGGVAVCIDAGGFAGSILRSVTSAVFLLPNAGYPAKFFKTAIEAAPWVAAQTGLTEPEVTATLRFAAQQLGPAAQ